VAAGFLSSDYSPSYATLVQRFTGDEIAKHETRSDWLARPLRAEQLQYAVADVAYLHKLYDAQCSQLVAMGRWDWFIEEMRNRVGYSAVDPDECYRNVARAWRCDGRALARLQRVCAWRERYAREKDLPRGRVVKDDELVELVCQPHISREVIARTLDPAGARRHGRELTALIAEADALSEAALPEPLPAPLTPADARTMKTLKSVGAGAARALNIAEELLSRRRDLESCLRSVRESGGLPPNFLGWRHALVGEKFAALLDTAAS
jgi:ribonuclease D